jgi:hypothetical protein
VLVGNVRDADTQGTGWSSASATGPAWVGPISSPFRKTRHWPGFASRFDHPSGHDSGSAKPVSEGQTVLILVSDSSRFRIEFCESPDFGSSEGRDRASPTAR